MVGVRVRVRVGGAVYATCDTRKPCTHICGEVAEARVEGGGRRGSTVDANGRVFGTREMVTAEEKRPDGSEGINPGRSGTEITVKRQNAALMQCVCAL
jgi:hypothetical protein